MVGARSECNSNPSIVFFSAAERIPGMAAANGVHQLQLQNGQMQQCKAVSVHCTAFEDCTSMPLLLVHWCWCSLHLAGALVLVVQLHSCPCLRARHLTLPPHDEPHCPRCTTALMPLLNCIHCSCNCALLPECKVHCLHLHMLCHSSVPLSSKARIF